MQQYGLGAGLNRKQGKKNVGVLVDRTWKQVSSIHYSPRPHFTVPVKMTHRWIEAIPLCSHLCRTVLSWESPSTRQTHTGWCNRWSIQWRLKRLDLWEERWVKKSILLYWTSYSNKKSHHYIELSTGIVRRWQTFWSWTQKTERQWISYYEAKK